MPDAARGASPGPNRGFFRDLAAGDGRLLDAIMRFNAEVAAGGGGNGAAGPVAGLLDASPRGRQALLRLKGAGPGFWSFEEESTRLALLEPETLADLCRHFGAAVNARAICLVVRRAEVEALRSALGADLLAYAMGRGAFHLGETRQRFLSRHQNRPLAERVELHGREALGVCASRWPEPLRRLAAARFPDLLGGAPGAGRDHALERMVWFGLKKLLIKEVSPQWAPCFS